MARRDFDKEIAAETVERDEPVEFKLFGRMWDCRDDVNGKLLMDRAADLDSDSLQQQRDGVVGIFQMCVLDDQIDALLDTLEDPNRVVQLAKLVEIVGWLVEEYSERPTKPPVRSQGGRASRGSTSTGKPRARGPRSVASVPATT